MITHDESEAHRWTIAIPGHAPRTDSKRYRHSRSTLKQLVAAAAPSVWGAGDAEDHHGGGLWLWQLDRPETGKPFVVKNIVGMEWSSQFCADPLRVDLLRLNALNLYTLFPNSVRQLDAMGCDASNVLATPIMNAADVAEWVDSIFNASVPLPKAAHTGVYPVGEGVHHYPQPIIDIEYVKRADFNLWVDDGTGVSIAVVPIAPPGSGVAKIAVAYAPPHSILHEIYSDLRQQGQPLILGGDHPIAQAAFAAQQ